MKALKNIERIQRQLLRQKDALLNLRLSPDKRQVVVNLHTYPSSSPSHGAQEIAALREAHSTDSELQS